MNENSVSIEILAEAAGRIPIRNVWHLLLYAWDMARYQGHWPAEAEASPSLLGLLAQILASATRILLRRQLRRAFAIRNEAIRGLRGRIDLATSLKRLSFHRGTVYCTFSDLSVDTPKNRILRATLQRLASDPRVYHFNPQQEGRLRHELRSLVRSMRDVRMIPIASTDFSRLQLGRNDRDYALPLTICALIHRLEIPTEVPGDHAMFALLHNEIRFDQLFERFVRNFCRVHFPNCDVRPEALTWPDDLGCELVPAMRTDITITAKNAPYQRLVIDTKYYAKTLSTSLYGTQKFRSDNLYQLYAYLRTQEQRSASHLNASGMLLYPTTDRVLNESMFVQGHAIRVATLDLSQAWEKIEGDIVTLVTSAMYGMNGMNN